MRAMFPTLLMLILIASGLTTPVAAQTGMVPHPAIGLKAGLASSSWSVQGTSTDNRSGVTGGAFLRLPLNWMALQMEVLWSQKGFEKRAYGGYTDIELHTNNFEVPLALVFELPAQTVHLYLMGGMSFGVITGTEIRHSGTDGWESVDNVLTGTSTLAILGIGLRHEKIGLEFRINHGINNLAESKAAGEIKDRGFAITASYALWD